MTLAAVKGQDRAVEALRAALRSATLHHAYLFAGPSGVGKELTALGFVQSLLCLERPQEGCGTCGICTRVQKHNHPDVTWVMPEEEQVRRGLAGRSDFSGTASREIKVEQVRQLQERLSYRPLEGAFKVALIISSEQLNAMAQNALLKTLEEPPPRTLMILLTSSLDKLLPTLRSRCSKVYFGPLPRALLAAEVAHRRKLDPATADLVAVMAAGSLGQALEYDVDKLKRRRDVIERFEAVTAKDARTVLRFAEDFGSSREDALSALEILSLWIRDVAIFRAGGGGPARHENSAQPEALAKEALAKDALANKDLRELLEKVAPRYDEAGLHRRREMLGVASRAILRNGAARLQLERMLLRSFTPREVGP